MLRVDGSIAWRQRIGWADTGRTYACGATGGQHTEVPVDVDVTIPHTADAVTLWLGSTVARADEHWGFQDVELWTLKHFSPPSPPPPSPPPLAPPPPNREPLPYLQYLFGVTAGQEYCVHTQGGWCVSDGPGRHGNRHAGISLSW